MAGWFPLGASTDPWISLDGRTGATGGTAQFPSLLSGYLIRPPWQVAGVDYAVGLKSNVSVDTSTDIITITGTQNNHINGQKVSFRTANGGTLPTGVSLDTAYFVVNVSGNTFKVSATSGGAAIDLGGSPNGVVVLKIPVLGTNCMPSGVRLAVFSGSVNEVYPDGTSDATNGNVANSGTVVIDSYDFSFDGGVRIYGRGASGKTVNVHNNYFKFGSNRISFTRTDGGDLSSYVFNMRYNEFDGAGLTLYGTPPSGVDSYFLYVMAPGTYEYNYFHHAICETMSPGAKNITLQYNVWFALGYGDQTTHYEPIGFFPDGGSVCDNFVQQYNLIYQPVATTFPNSFGYPASMDSAGVLFLKIFNPDHPNFTVNNITAFRNTAIAKGSTGHSDSATLTGAAAWQQGWAISAQPGNTINGISITENYVDSSGIASTASIISDDPGVGGTHLNKTYSPNWSMTTGATIIAPNHPGTQ